MFNFTPAGYSNNNTAESLTDDEEEGRDPSVWRPLPGGPFSALISSMWPQKSDKLKSNPDGQAGKFRIDEFGFKVEENDENEPSDGVLSEPFIEDAQHRLRWIAFLEFTFNNQVEELSWDKLGTRLPRSEKLRTMIHQGIPHSLRSHIWMRISSAMEKKIKSELPYKEMVKASTEETSMTAKQIEKDLLRTLPTNLCFTSLTSVGVPRLRRILRAIAWLYPDIGYCQGTGMIVASLLLVMEEEDAFWMTCAIFEDLLPGSYYSSSLIGAQADQRVLRQLIASHLPEIDLVLKRHDIEIALICLHWFLTLFSSVVPVRLLWRIWDLFFYGGSVVLFQLALGMIKAKETQLVAEENTASIFNVLSDIPAQLRDIDAVIELGVNKVAATLTDTLIETHRRKHLAYLMADQGLLNNPDPNRPLPKERITRRQLKRSQSLFLSLFSSVMSSDDASDDEFLRDKNVRQTELLVDLKEALLQIIRHFQTNDAQYADISTVTDYSMQSHARDHERFAAFAQTKRKRAKALLDFERHEEDELGFRKNDIITILSQRDEHCWIGDLNGVRGWFPAKFVELIDERSKEYSAAGDDSVTESIADLVRGILCPTLKAIFEHGLRRTSLLGGACHPWLFIEEAASKEVEKDFDSVVSRLLLCRTFRLDEDGKVLTPEEILFRCVQLVNSTHDPAHAQMDVKFRSLVVLGLNEQVLHLWLECLCSCVNVVEKWYYPWSFLRSPGWVQIKCELRVLAQLAFRLSHDWELPRKCERNNPLRDGVRDMLIKHHLFSWEI